MKKGVGRLINSRGGRPMGQGYQRVSPGVYRQTAMGTAGAAPARPAAQGIQSPTGQGMQPSQDANTEMGQRVGQPMGQDTGVRAPKQGQDWIRQGQSQQAPWMGGQGMPKQSQGAGHWVGPNGQPVSGIDPGFTLGNKFVNDGQQNPWGDNHTIQGQEFSPDYGRQYGQFGNRGPNFQYPQGNGMPPPQQGQGYQSDEETRKWALAHPEYSQGKMRPGGID